MRSHLLLILLAVVLAHMPAADTSIHLDLRVVSDEVWRADVRAGWVAAYLADRSSLDWTLILPVASPPVPVPDLQGRYRTADWEAFIAAPLNPTKNAVRLLGPPSTVERLPDGQFRLAWNGPRLTGVTAQQHPDPCSVELVTNDAGQVTWRYVPVVAKRVD